MLHFITACSVVRFGHPVSFLQSDEEGVMVHARKWGLSTTECLPHSHSKRPLRIKIFQKSTAILLTLIRASYHITFFREVAITETFRSHPLDWQLYATSITLSKIVPSKHLLRQAKVSDFYQEMSIDPAVEWQ